MKASRWASWLIAAYPPSFRTRYGAELAAVVEECPTPGTPLALDLGRGAMRAWLRPVFAGNPAESSRRRLQASVSSVFVAFSVALLASAGFARDVDDAPVPGLRQWGLITFHISMDTFEVIAALVTLAGLVFWMRLALRAARQGRHRLLILALTPIGIVTVWLGISALTGLVARHTVGHQTNMAQLGWWKGLVVLAALAAYLAITLMAASACVFCALKALNLYRPSADELRWAAAVGTVAAGGLAVEAVATAVCLGLIAAYGGMDVRTMAIAVVGTAVLLLAGTAASVASVRGLRVIRA